MCSLEGVGGVKNVLSFACRGTDVLRWQEYKTQVYWIVPFLDLSNSFLSVQNCRLHSSSVHFEQKVVSSIFGNSFNSSCSSNKTLIPFRICWQEEVECIMGNSFLKHSTQIVSELFSSILPLHPTNSRRAKSNITFFIVL